MKTNYFLMMNRQNRTLGMSLIMAVAAFISAMLVISFNEPATFFKLEAMGSIGVPAALAAAITGAFWWWLVVERSQKFTAGHFMFAGLLCGLFSHPVMWVGMTLTGLPYGPSEWTISGLSTFLWWILSITTLSLVLTGWATAIVGSLGGLIFFLIWNPHRIAKNKELIT